MEPARARYKNYVTDQRYHDAVDGTRNEMENLFVQIRIVFSIVGTLHRGGKQACLKSFQDQELPREVGGGTQTPGE